MKKLKQKTLKYIILLLLIPLIISLILAIAGYKTQNYGPSRGYDSISGNTNDDYYTYDEQVRRSNGYIYITVLAFVTIGACVWIYVRKKGDI